MNLEEKTANHNKVAMDITSSIVREPLLAGGTVTDVMVLMESVLTGVALACIKLGGDDKVLDVMVDAARKRLAEARLKDIAPEGRG